jgi:hypothetical protein
MRTAFIASVSAVVSVTALISPVAASSFSDVPDSSSAAAAIEFVKENGIMKGYDNGTFKPNQPITRAEVAKILVLTKLSEDEVQTYTKQSFTDVPADAWYRAYVEAAMLKLGIVDGPPKATAFNGAKTVRKVEFLKMLLKAQDVDATSAYSEIKLPLATDVTDVNAWFYPYMRYAVSASLEQVDADGTLKPDKELTRADAAVRIHRLAMYKAGRRTQALLSSEEDDLVNVLALLQNKDLAQAQYAAGRAVLAARGANASKSGVAIVQAAVKISEAFYSLVTAYQAGNAGDAENTISYAKQAWSSADRAKQLSPTLADLANSVQQIASSMAASARGQ